MSGFTGHWLVSEYVYEPNGTFVGVIQQRRMLDQLDNGRIRIVQQCITDHRLSEHPMKEFAGEWIFEIEVRGSHRIYHGPDVIGMGISWGKDALTGKGFWTTFGHNFTSFGILVTPERQITGGKFYHAHEMIANIIGVAEPEHEDTRNQYPSFTDLKDPPAIPAHWIGMENHFDTFNTNAHQVGIKIQCSAQDETIYREDAKQVMLNYTRQPDHQRVNGSYQGISKDYGWLRETVLMKSPEVQIETQQVIDLASKHLVRIEQTSKHHVPQNIKIAKLKSIHSF